MIICTVVLLLLTVLIATEADPQEAAPAQDKELPPAATPDLGPDPRRRDPAVNSDRAVIPGAGKFRFVRQSHISSRAALSFSSTRS